MKKSENAAPQPENRNRTYYRCRAPVSYKDIRVYLDSRIRIRVISKSALGRYLWALGFGIRKLIRKMGDMGDMDMDMGGDDMGDMMDEQHEEEPPRPRKVFNVSWDDFERQYGTPHRSYSEMITYMKRVEPPYAFVDPIKTGRVPADYHKRQDYSVQGYWDFDAQPVASSSRFGVGGQ